MPTPVIEEGGRKEKVDAFIKDYGDLREKHRMDFLSIPTFTPNEKGNWELKIVPQVISLDDLPVKSPFVTD